MFFIRRPAHRRNTSPGARKEHDMKTYSQPRLTITVLVLAALIVFVLASRPARAAEPWYVAPGGSDGNTLARPALTTQAAPPAQDAPPRHRQGSELDALPFRDTGMSPSLAEVNVV